LIQSAILILTGKVITWQITSLNKECTEYLILLLGYDPLDNLSVLCLASTACGILGQRFGYYVGKR